ncbi:Scr1 family TA system antitoxin-like transcriptional regulator [Streptomyces sp. INA 01156]
MMRERPTVPFGFIVEESVLRRGPGGTQVQASMLDHVRELTAPRDVTLRAVRVSASNDVRACCSPEWRTAGPHRVPEPLVSSRP